MECSGDVPRMMMQADSTKSTSRPFPPGSNSAGTDSTVSRQEREELLRVLAHPEISRSASLVRFLTFICNKYFEGQSEAIREYSIAVEALGRKEANFDSRVDPIVRVTARALRKKLAGYYRAEGRENPLRIVLPLGHYIPQFVPRPESGEEPEAVNAEEQDVDPAVEAHDLSQEDSRRTRSGFARQVLYSLRRFWKLAAAASALIAVFAIGFLLGSRTDKHAASVSETLQWGQPVWSDEFDGAAQQLPDPSRWTFDTGGGGWGAKQVQIYCGPGGAGPRECSPHRPNAFIDGAGHLVLRAEKGPDGAWTSARITTRGLKDFQFGRIEARIKMPVGKGIWPSVWMLGSNFFTAGWPAAGSFTSVENVALDSDSNGLGPGMIRATVHGPHFYGANGLWHNFRLPSNGRVDDGSFHTYGVIWSPSMIQFYVDDPANVYFVANAKDIPEGGQWVFDHPFYLIMNLGIGGDWPGNPDATTCASTRFPPFLRRRSNGSRFRSVPDPPSPATSSCIPVDTPAVSSSPAPPSLPPRFVRLPLRR